jgi:hypothetical protein
MNRRTTLRSADLLADDQLEHDRVEGRLLIDGVLSRDELIEFAPEAIAMTEAAFVAGTSGRA